MNGRLSEDSSEALKVIKTVSNILTRIIWMYAITLGTFLTVLVFLQVVMRYVFSSGIPWVNELSQYLAIWMLLPLAAVLIREDDHIKISVLVDRFSGTTIHRIAVAELLVIFLFGLGFTYAGSVYALESGFRSVSPSLGIEMFWIYIILPISGVLFCFYTIVRIAEILSQTRDEIATELGRASEITTGDNAE